MRRRIKVWLDIDDQPNESYGAGDGLSFHACHRCGLTLGARVRLDFAFCGDCNYPDSVGVFLPADYSYIFEGAA